MYSFISKNNIINGGFSRLSAESNVSLDRLAWVETAFNAAWTGPTSTPFITDIQTRGDLLDEAAHFAHEIPLWRLFNSAPTLAVWAVLIPLARNYGISTNEVYRHISRFVGESFDEQEAREDLKTRYRRTARALGLPVFGNEPTGLFFAPLGPAHAHHGDLARAFVGAALHIGPPAIEDTASARRWQRRIVADRCAGLARLKATIAFDTSAHVARRFEAWRQGESPVGDTEAHLFEAYDQAARSLGRSRADIVGPPRLVWTGDHLTLETETSRELQSLRLGAIPTRLAGGKRLQVPPPWRPTIRWTAGTLSRDIPLAPAEGEVLVFDADTGAMLSRLSSEQGELEIAAERLIVLSAAPFTSLSFGDAIPAKDASFRIAWVNADETLAFEGRSDLSFTRPVEDAIWIDAPVLGRDGSRALYACNGGLQVRIDPEIGGPTRIIRTRIGGQVRFHQVDLGATGELRMAFADAHLEALADPAEVLFEVLTPGAAGDLEARVALTTRCWIWPGISAPDGDLADVPIPANFDPARSAGLRAIDGRLSVDPEADQETPILGLSGPDRVHEFRLVARGEKLWHFRVARGDRVYVPRGATLVFGHANRHDALILRSPDRDASLLVLGRETRRPFYRRQTIEIGAADLEEDTEDDRIALRRADGRVDLLARLRRATDPAGLEISEDPDEIRLRFTPRTDCDALRVRIEPVRGALIEGEYAFGRAPLDLPSLQGVRSKRDPATSQVEVILDPSQLPAPARATFLLRDNAGVLLPLRDVRNAPVAIGLAGEIDTPQRGHLLDLARFLAEPQPDSLGGQIGRALSPAYEAALDHVGKSHMLGSIKPLLAVVREDRQPPRHDLVGATPWIFEASPIAFGGLDTDTGLAPISDMAGEPSPVPPPRVDGDTPLSDWLGRVSTGAGIPTGFQADRLQHAFQALRWRLKETDLHDLVGEETLAGTVKLICGAHVEGLEKLRSFDTGGGADPLPARIAAQVERLARSCAERRSHAFVDDVVFRTGLPRREVGQALTLMLRGGVEFFAYFRALWAHASKDGSPSA
ncbi:hypothetical protein [Rhodovulum sulfidophilum]|uniref:hypothetical protein n=1 Tax=Rhodovulum sulfidophilum TaxID=35806 RepID=UPI001389C1CA|nr:hypothetical protein [Rhodovulum sulfidophilum]NDK36719.1 hypothetical protein [Rhodovulum sulfidophilum]